LSGAIHGDEIVGVEIIRQLLDALEPDAIAGAVIAAPVVNVFGFVFESRYLPDRRDLNRSFPGSKRGSLAARLARLFMDEVVSRSDVGIDFHAGSDGRTNLPQIRGNLKDPETRRLSTAFGAPVMIHAGTIKGSLRSAALKQGKRVLLFEGGEPSRFNPAAVQAGVEGTLRVMVSLGGARSAGRAAERGPAHAVPRRLLGHRLRRDGQRLRRRGRLQLVASGVRATGRRLRHAQDRRPDPARGAGSGRHSGAC
jgi:predicted deacylase